MSPFSKLLTFLGVLALALCRVAPPAAAADVEETEKAGTIVSVASNEKQLSTQRGTVERSKAA